MENGKLEKEKKQKSEAKNNFGKRKKIENEEKVKRRREKPEVKKYNSLNQNTLIYIVLVLYLGHIAVRQVKCNQYLCSKEFIHTLNSII